MFWHFLEIIRTIVPCIILLIQIMMLNGWTLQMFGLIGTIGVISQMAMLAFGYAPALAMAIGSVAALAWIAHAIRNRDRWLLTVNASVLMFATYGLLQ